MPDDGPINRALRDASRAQAARAERQKVQAVRRETGSDFRTARAEVQSRQKEQERLLEALRTAEPRAARDPEGFLGKPVPGPKPPEQPRLPPPPQSNPVSFPKENVASTNVGTGVGVLQPGQQVVGRGVRAAPGSSLSVALSTDGRDIVIDGDVIVGEGVYTDSAGSGQVELIEEHLPPGAAVGTVVVKSLNSSFGILLEDGTGSAGTGEVSISLKRFYNATEGLALLQDSTTPEPDFTSAKELYFRTIQDNGKGAIGIGLDTDIGALDVIKFWWKYNHQADPPGTDTDNFINVVQEISDPEGNAELISIKRDNSGAVIAAKDSSNAVGFKWLGENIPEGAGTHSIFAGLAAMTSSGLPAEEAGAVGARFKTLEAGTNIDFVGSTSSKIVINAAGTLSISMDNEGTGEPIYDNRHLVDGNPATNTHFFRSIKSANTALLSVATTGTGPTSTIELDMLWDLQSFGTNPIETFVPGSFLTLKNVGAIGMAVFDGAEGMTWQLVLQAGSGIAIDDTAADTTGTYIITNDAPESTVVSNVSGGVGVLVGTTNVQGKALTGEGVEVTEAAGVVKHKVGITGTGGIAVTQPTNGNFVVDGSAIGGGTDVSFRALMSDGTFKTLTVKASALVAWVPPEISDVCTGSGVTDIQYVGKEV